VEDVVKSGDGLVALDRGLQVERQVLPAQNFAGA
jgi:hypothetical protein